MGKCSGFNDILGSAIDWRELVVNDVGKMCGVDKGKEILRRTWYLDGDSFAFAGMEKDGGLFVRHGNDR